MTRRTQAHLAFMTVIGFAAWAVLIVATYDASLFPSPPRQAGLVPFTLFFLVIVGVRSLAIPILPGAVISLDSAFYIAAVICLGTASAGRLVALALTLDALVRYVGGEPAAAQPDQSRAESLAFIPYFGGLTGALLLGVGLLFGVDQQALVGRPDAEAEILGGVFALGGSFLVCHYLVQGLRRSIAGLDAPTFLRRMALPGILAEASLLPLAAVVVILFRPERPLAFVLLGSTYVLVNYVFNRFSRASSNLRSRVAELETLNRTARALSATLQQSDLTEAIARETLAAVPEAEALALARRDGEGWQIDVADRQRGEFQRLRTPPGEGLTDWVAVHKQVLAIPDLARSDLVRRGDSGMRSWLGVPIIIHDEVIGVLSVQSRARDAFGPYRARLLEAIGAQASVAIENARLYELATVDGLTGLYVRRYFDARLKEELERTRRFHSPFSLLLLDIDDFKHLNDTHGHPVGDRVLRDLAGVVKRCMRGVDIPARYGGEEFTVILPRTGIVEAHVVAERIRQDVADFRFHTDDRLLRVTVSIGVASYPESGEGDAAAVVRRADVALYRAKATGKNRVELYWSSEEAERQTGTPGT